MALGIDGRETLTEARLSRSEWGEVRLAWESSPRAGLAWLTAPRGGRWPVTEEAIRLRRRAEGWTKRGKQRSVVREAHRIADRTFNGLPGLELGPELGSGDDKEAKTQSASEDAVHAAWAEQLAALVRAAVVERHRAE